MDPRENLNKELKDKIPKILQGLEDGNDIIIKITPGGIKIQSMKVTTIK